MSDAVGVAVPSISAGQLELIARKFGALAGKTFVDVGAGDAAWLRRLAQRGHKVFGIEERNRTRIPADNVVTLGSPAATVPFAAHSVDAILFRGTSAFEAGEFQPESMIALANLGSSLKRRGALLIPVANEGDAARWERQLAVFPGRVRTRTLKTGLMSYLTLAFLFGGGHQVRLLEFRATGKLLSRLEWHRLAREAVMAKLNPPAAA